MARLLSVNIGRPEHVPGHHAPTGIIKRPVDGPVEIGRLGLLGDAIIDRKYHGGPDQAVYIYLQSDYDFWAGELGRVLEPGTFGENLTISGVDGGRLSVGDRFAIGSVLLEVTSHRTPCNTFAARMGDRTWAKRFFKAGRPGAYARVLQEGALQAGQPIEYTSFMGEPVLVSDLLALEGKRDIEIDMLKRGLASPIHPKIRADFEKRLAALA
ncbi:MOSC domain-containing protein [Flaviflagellibacter deserti]|uniref:MOSC domain-containing protein n=1 Tax=Flaviflagellibacter deserti TaxID=2267266 RepID=A0ABV9Z3H3_9HYPH